MWNITSDRPKLMTNFFFSPKADDKFDTLNITVLFWFSKANKTVILLLVSLSAFVVGA